MVFCICFSKARLHRDFHMNQQVIIQTSHFWLLCSLFPLDVESVVLSHSSNGLGTCSSRVNPSVPNHTCRGQLHPNIRCSLVSISSQVGQRGDIGIPLHTRFNFIAIAFDTSFHINIWILGHTLTFKIDAQTVVALSTCCWRWFPLFGSSLPLMHVME